MKEITKTIAKINNVNIILIDEEEKYVPIKPICVALGISPYGQVSKIKRDEILKSVARLKCATGSDGKEHEMFCLPYLYVFGWLFTVNQNYMKAEVKENLIRFKPQCYTALSNYFSDRAKFLELKQIALETQLGIVDRFSNDYAKTKEQLNEAREILYAIKKITFEEWKSKNRELALKFSLV